MSGDVSAEQRAAEIRRYTEFVDEAASRVGQEVPGSSPNIVRLGHALRRVSGSIVYDLEATVQRPAGWSWASFRVGYVLWVNGPTEPSDIAALAGISRAAASATIKTLVARRLLTRTASVKDRRSALLALTPEAHETLSAMYARHHELESRWFGTLEEHEQLILLGLLEKLRTGHAARSAARRQ